MISRMKVTTMNATSLTATLIDQWNRLQASNPALDSPFFSASFMQAVGAERKGAEVAVIESSDEVVGFLPYCRQRGGVATPIAGQFTDFQGVIAAPQTSLDMRSVLRASRLSAWQFDHLVTGADYLNRYQWAHFDSPFIDLSEGFDVYRDECRKRAGKEMSELLRKSRKLNREVATASFEPETTNSQILDRLIEWKQQQLQRQRLTNGFRPAWVLPMLNRMLYTRGERFQSMLSTLYVGEEPAAINFGLRSGEVLHGWITAFNPKFRKFSPGLMLIIKLAEVAETFGITRLDMGRGDESFKRKFCSGSTRVAQGAVDRRLVAGTINHSWVCAKEALRGTSFGAPSRRFVQRLRYQVGELSVDS
jgi:CelD/BcsL family acetyltransferase involved in cellulose biosynthesis